MSRRLERFRVLLAPESSETTRYGHFVNPVTGEQIPYVDKLAKIFKAGVHRGKPYSEADIDRLVSNFKQPASETDWSTPLYKDHEPGMDNTVGSVRALERRGKGVKAQLWGWIRLIGSEAISKLASGLYRKLSAGIFYDEMTLDEVSLVPDPYFDDTQLFHKNQKEDTTVPDETKPKEEAKGAGLPPRKRSRDGVHALSAINDKWEERFSAQKAENETLRKQLEDQQSEFEAFRKERLANKAGTRVELFRSQGKTTKAMADHEKSFVATLSDEQFSLYEKVKESAPELFQVGEVYGSLGKTPGGGATKPGETDSKERVKTLVEKYGKGAKSKKDEE